ncbi:IclR family transcriptional regulator [Nocardia sp. BMG111209]|uniref:IclR family transcriptional regulator n=1 Tax=Nocardia sp. BMG111209 TaxID=1160137 RepID=UPI000368093B|nr:IclR family transcriptional regulator [Nocardia sp. BMG111209]
MAGGSGGESVLSRVLRILELFDADSPEMTVSELARRSGLPLPTVSRLAAEMVAEGLLQRDQRRRLRTGVRLWELASRAATTVGLRQAAMPFMEDLHAVVGHHVQLSVLHGREVLVVERLSAPGGVFNISRIAGRLPAHVSSGGLVLLAHAPAEMQEQALAGPLRRYTAHTVSDPHTLRRMLSEIRRTGIVMCPGYIDERTTGIATPLRGRDGRVIAALSVIVPNDDEARTAIPALLAAARGISRVLGALPGSEPLAQ